jgi:hypothetical protein
VVSVKQVRHVFAAFLLTVSSWGCGSTDPSPVGIDLVDLAGGEVVEIIDIPSLEVRSRFREIFPSVLGRTEELLIGQMNGIHYVGLMEMGFEPSDLPGGSAGSLVVDSLFVELRILGDLTRGDLGAMVVSVPNEPWSELRAFVDTTNFLGSSFDHNPIADALPTRIDSTIRVALPVSLFQDAVIASPTNPVVAFGLSGGADGDSDFMIVVSANDTLASANAPQLVAYLSGPDGSAIARARTTKDTYFAERRSTPGEGELLIQTGVFYAGVLRFDLPAIPETATVNLVELTMDYDFDRSFLSSLRLRIEQLSVVNGDTSFAVVSGNFLNEQIVSPTSSPFKMNLDQLLFHGWMSGARVNEGLIINPIFEIVPDLRYQWALFTNPRVRIVYSLPPSLGT